MDEVDFGSYGRPIIHTPTLPKHWMLPSLLVMGADHRSLGCKSRASAGRQRKRWSEPGRVEKKKAMRRQGDHKASVGRLTC